MMEALWSRFAVAYMTLEKEIQSRKLGEPQFEANFGLPIATDEFFSKKEYAGSVVMDISINIIQFAWFIFKEDPINIIPLFWNIQMTIRWGIVTSGSISNDFVNAINSYPDKGDQVISAVAARNVSNAEQFAKTHKIPTVFTSYAEMAQSKAIDVAYIGALNPQHYELTKLFLESGKHVLCEKPLCLNSKQTQSLINIARSKNIFLMEAVWSRFCPLYVSLQNEIQTGKLGDVKFVEVNLGAAIEDVGRISKKEFGGSALLDLGIYTLQFAQFIFKDEPLRLTSVSELNEEGVDLVDTMILEYSNGRRAVLNINAKLKLWNKATVVGTVGRATLEEPFHFPDTFIRADGKVERLSLHKSHIKYNFQNSAGLVYEALEVVRCIKEGLIESPRMTHQESLLLAKLRDTVREQAGVHFDADDIDY